MPAAKPIRHLILCGAYFVLHLVAHYSAAWFEVAPGGVAISIWYAPAGLALSLLLLLGPRYAPVVLLANVTGTWLIGGVGSWGSLVWFPLLMTANYAATAWLVRRTIGIRLLPGQHRQTLVFFSTIVLSPLVYALVATLVAMDGAPPSGQAFWQTVFQWWIGDASGLLTVVPVVAVFVAPYIDERRAVPRPRPRSLRGDFLTIAASVALLGSVWFMVAAPVLPAQPALYLSFLPLVWICMNHGMRGAVLATLLVTMTGLVGMRLMESTADFAYVFLLFEVAVAGVGLGLGSLVSRQQVAEYALSQSRAQLDRVIAGAQTGLWDWHVGGEDVATNDHLAAMLGYESAEIEPLRERWIDLVHPHDLPAEQAAWADHLAGKTDLYEAQFRLRTKRGSWHWVLSRGSVVQRDAAGAPLRMSGIVVDINARKRAEAEIGRLLRIIEATPDWVFTSEANGTVLYVNTAMLEGWGIPGEVAAWSGRSIEEFLTPTNARRLRDEAVPAALRDGIWQGEVALTMPTGQERPTALVVLAHRDEELDTAILSFILRDLSMQKQAEEKRMLHERQIMQVQKDESLSVLAGGIAHDFNNLMMSVVGSANLARLDIPAGSEASDCLDTMERAAVRASALCQQMLAYAGRSPVEFAEIDLNELIAETLRLVEPSLARSVTLRFSPQEPLPRVLAAMTQTQQVVMNLVLNAAHAIGERAGTVEVSTHCRHLTAADLRSFHRGDERLLPGDYLLLEVADDGPGMTAEVKQRIFEPFYSTKFTGSGLGLAVVMGFLRTHRGGIEVQSEPGAGARFRVLLPLKPPTTEPVESDKGDEADATPSKRTVLLVDDDATLRRVIERMLRNLGFEVVSARDGVEGVEVFRQNADRLACVLLDITMPRMDGFEAHTAMDAIAADVPVILMSGYSQKLANLPPEAIHPAAVLAKPFDLPTLRARLAAVQVGG